METIPESNLQAQTQPNSWRISLYILGALLLFFVALGLMISSFQYLGRDTIFTIISATTNPFTGLFIGLLITAMIQSSSTTTALVVALVATGSLSLQGAIPIIMGANVGTTITSTIVSLGFIGKKKEFKRAVAAGTYHCFFNLLTVIILFPLEYNYGFLSRLSSSIAAFFFRSGQPVTQHTTMSWSGLDPLISYLVQYVPGVVIIAFSFVLLFASILFFRRVISDLLKARSPEAFSRFFFRNEFKSFSWGLLTTAAIRSSTITTSVVVPVVAKKITTLRQAAPFIMGANVGTTITAFIAAALNGSSSGAMSIAIAHFLFNVIGVLIFFPVHVLREVPIKLSSGLGKLTLRYPLACFVFLLFTFFIIPFSLIYFDKDSQTVTTLTYKVVDANKKDASYYRLISRMYLKQRYGDWSRFEGESKNTGEIPVAIYPVRIERNTVFAGKNVYALGKVGDCWEGRDEQGNYRACLQQADISAEVANQQFDSVYVFNTVYINKSPHDTTWLYFDARHNVILKKQSRELSEILVSIQH